MPGPSKPSPPYAQQAFARALADRTGLNNDVTLGWVYAENGPPDNPLNIMASGNVAHYGSSSAALDATTKLILTSPNYGAIRSAAQTGQTPAQVAAIAASPWDAGHYTLHTQGDKLAGAVARAKATLTGSSGGIVSGIGGAITGIPGAVAGIPGDVTGAASSALSGAENFIVDKATVGLSYVALVGLALALIVLGTNKATGGGVVRTLRSAPVPVPV